MAQILVFIKKLHGFSGSRLYVYLFGMMFISMMEGFGIFLLVPMFSIIGILPATSQQIPLISWMVEPLSGFSAQLKLTVILGIFLLVLIGQTLLQRYLTVLNEAMEQGFIRHLRLELYENILMSDWSFFLKKRKSDVVQIMTGELPRVSYGVYQALRLLTAFLFTAVQVGIALWLSVGLTLSVLFCGAILTLCSRRFIRQSRAVGERTTLLSQRYIAGMTDQLNGMKDIKSNLMENQYLIRFRSVCDDLEHNFVRFAKLQAVSQSYYKMASGVLIVLFALLSFTVFHVQPERLVLVVVIFSRLWPRFSALQSGMEQLARTVPAFRALSELQKDCGAAQEKAGPVPHHSEKPVPIRNGIQFRNVSYRYDRNDSFYALQDIRLEIKANALTAVVGKSGAGKSTLIDMMTGLLKPESGEVTVDEEPMDHHSFRRAVGYVPQDPFLFHDSIRENLLLGAPEATEEQLWEALKFSCSDMFVRNLPEGLDTVLGDRGVRLSGGERQRIVLARAILRQPSILILDEATSALDSENEAKIKEALDRLKGKMTIVVVAHRLSTIRHADMVVVVDKGRIIQMGGYQDLTSEREGMLSRMLSYQAQ